MANVGYIEIVCAFDSSGNVVCGDDIFTRTDLQKPFKLRIEADNKIPNGPSTPLTAVEFQRWCAGWTKLGYRISQQDIPRP
jgi:hypothetical protein